jgi:uncharacterized damage-inducible protein DinB
MYQSVDAFLGNYEQLAKSTQAYLDALTDESLDQAVADGHRTLGRIAWHVVQTIPEMMGQTGLTPKGPGEGAAVPETAAAIADAYREASASLLSEVRGKWSDQALNVEDDLYGMKWKRGLTLHILDTHQAHHMGQMSVLMRQAGLKVPGAFGPSKEEWARSGMEPPAI